MGKPRHVPAWGHIVRTIIGADVIKLLELIQTHQQWVYGLLLAYTLAKTGPFSLVAGYVSGTGALDFGLVIAACSVGTIAGSNIRFFVGSLLSSRLFRWSPKAAPWIALGAVGVDRFGFWLLPLYRFSKGTFTLVGLGAGISMNHRRFVVLDAIGAALWIAAMVGVGRGLWLLGLQVKPEWAAYFGLSLIAYFSPSWTAFQVDGGRDFNVVVDGVSV